MITKAIKALFFLPFVLTLALSGCMQIPEVDPPNLTLDPPFPTRTKIYDGADAVVRVDTLDTNGKYTGERRWEYPNGYRSTGSKMDHDWRKKGPTPDYRPSIDSFSSSGSAGSGGATSGTVTMPRF